MNKNVDTTKINTIEWFFGYGGNHLGLKRILPGLQLIAACEIEGYAVANMVQKMEAGLLDSAPIWTDAKTFPGRLFHGLVDLFIASYPCQGFSCAGKREGSRDPRFLWPWVYRFVIEARPRVVFFENVEGHVTLGLSTVISDLEEAGYAVEAGIFSAAECGAAHRRKRVFILGYDTRGGGDAWWTQCAGQLRAPALVSSSVMADTNRGGRTKSSNSALSESRNDSRESVGSGGDESLADAASFGEREQNDEECALVRARAREDSGGGSDELGDALGTRLEGRSGESANDGEEQPAAERTSLFWPSSPARPGEPQHAWEPPRVVETERGLGGGINGRAANVDRLRLLGNGVYPACAAKAFLVLAEKLAK